jgi:hypothetical protein
MQEVGHVGRAVQGIHTTGYKRRVVELGQEGAALKIIQVDLALDEGPALL